jgi:translation elongation factor EF-Tu-like GTPase
VELARMKTMEKPLPFLDRLNSPSDVEAEITFLSLEDGGRGSPAFDGYRPQFFYAGHDWDAVQKYPDVAQVNPGDTVRTYLWFLSPDEHVGRLRPGTAFLIREGRRVVGFGSISRIINLEQSAASFKANKKPHQPNEAG